MDDFNDLAIDEALRSELGKNAIFWRHERKIRTPMNFVLDEAERQMGPLFSVYWVKAGPPDVFCLTGFSPSPVVFSARYLSLTAFVRHLFVDDWLKNMLIEVAERTTLKLMAEIALWHGDPDYAVLAFAKSMIGKGIYLSDDDQLMDLEYSPVSEAYMATWFYPLVHEIGHLHPDHKQNFPNGHLFSDDAILKAITAKLDEFPTYSPGIKQEAVELATQRGSKSVIGIEHVRSEGLADMFAASVLFQASYDILREIKKPFLTPQFILELLVFFNIMTIIDRCSRVASIASTTVGDREAQFELALHPVAIRVRYLMQRYYLDSAITEFLYGSDHTPEQYQRIVKMVNSVNESNRETINAVDSGIARAMEFSLFPERRENDRTLLEAFRKDFAKSGLGIQEAQRFCRMADAIGSESKLLQALKGIVSDPSRGLPSYVTGDLLYLVPWLEGPNDFNCPFGLNTKYGHLVFAFNVQSELYDAFFKPSADSLKPGFALKTYMVAVPRKERLATELAARMPQGELFQVIIEGSVVFSRYIEELAAGTIWKD